MSKRPKGQKRHIGHSPASNLAVREAMDSAMVCVDPLCNRQLIYVLDSDGICAECGGQMYEANELDIQEIDEADEQKDLFEMISDRAFSGKQGGSGRYREDDAIWPRDRARDNERYGHSGGLTNGAITGGIAHVTSQPAVMKPSDTFSCPSDLSGCPIAAKAKVRIPLKMFRDWIILAERFNTEWIAYLLGFEVPGSPNTIEITEMYLPRQKATGVHVEAADGEIRPGTIAAVHSHVAMQAFFSGEDIAHFNHRIEMVINRAGDIKANGRVQLECGRFHRADAAVEFIEDAVEADLENQLKAVLTRDTGSSPIFTAPAATPKPTAPSPQSTYIHG